MNSFSTVHLSWFYSSFLFLLIINTAFSSTPASNTDVLYNDHCSSVVPESRPTFRVFKNPVPYLRTNYFVGGDNLLRGVEQYNHSNIRKSLRFRLNPNIYETVDKSIYKIEGHLIIGYAYPYSGNGRNSSYGSYYRNGRSSSSISFQLHGFWSDFSKKLCMIGSGSQRSTVEGHKALNLDAVLKLNFASDNPTIYTSVVSGTLKSIDSADDSRYFEPISIFSFPEINNYNYSLVSRELGYGVLDGGDLDFPNNESLNLEPSSFCTKISVGFNAFELVYAAECKTSKRCSPLGGDEEFLPHFVDLYPIQCSGGERKVRYMVTFQNLGYSSSFYGNFHLNSMFLAEGSWDDKNKRVLIVACRLLNPAAYSGNAVGDCSLRLSLKYHSIWTIRNNELVVGQILTNKSIDNLGYFKKIKLTSSGANDMIDFSGLRYLYTELDRVRKLCIAKEPAKKKGHIYPDGHSYDMRFDMSVKSSMGKRFAWGFAQPLSVENEMFERNHVFMAMSPESYEGVSTISAPARKSIPTVNISYKLSINPFEKMKFGTRFLALNSSMNHRGQVVINAEGMYNSETGQLCMVGCRKLRNESLDCDILVIVDFAPLNERRESVVIKGAIQSTRPIGDPLRFEELSISSAAFYHEAAKRSIWRIDLEITVVLISNTLMCIFLGIQIFHVKRNPDVLYGVSLFMLMILTLGLVIPLVLNFEALFSSSQDKQRLWLSTGGWIEANEVILRVITMVAFLLQIRLFQLVWSAKMSDESENSSWIGEKKAILVSLLMYIFGALVTLLLNWTKNRYGHQKYFLWGDLRSYFGLILDGFLFPQIILNAFRGSAEKALAHPFYIGTSVVRVVPHVYDQYRAHNYPASYVNGTYYYADHASDFYSTTWDVIIPCGVVLLALIVFFQQQHGGRCILPNRFMELELYEKVDEVDNE